MIGKKGGKVSLRELTHKKLQKLKKIYEEQSLFLKKLLNMFFLLNVFKIKSLLNLSKVNFFFFYCL